MFLPKKIVHRTKKTEHSVKFVFFNFLFLLFLAILLTSHLSLLTSNVLAQAEPRPRPIPFPCDKVSPNLPLRLDDEFHSLRPYQSSPCNPNLEETALFCGNDLVLSDNLTVAKQFFLQVVPIPRWSSSYSYEGAPIGPACFTDADCGSAASCGADGRCVPASCSDNGDGTETCLFSIDRVKQIAVDLSMADLPIMGYTEPSKGNESREKQVVNSNVQPDPETVLDAEKVNEYVSWYLNGVNERAEYPFLDVEKNCIGETTRKPGVCKPTILGTCLEPFIVPIPTLLQSDGKSSCTGATTQCCVSRSPFVDKVDILGRDKLINYSGPIKKLLSQSSQWRIRIDEIDDAFASRKDAEIRHDQVVGCTYGLPIRFGPFKIASVGNIPGPCYHENFLGFIKTDLALDLLEVRKLRRLSDWHPENENKLPPLEEDFPDFIDYLVAIRRWRGESCTVLEIPESILGKKVPVIGGQKYFLCGNNPGKPDFWSDLFNYIPFSSTEDRLGEVEITGAGVQPIQSNAIVTNVLVQNQQPAKLFFSHMEESAELADILQGTYVPRDEPRVGQIANVAPAEAPFCDLAQIRSNPGDDLFAGEIKADISYTTNISCNYVVEGSGLAGDPNNGNLCRFFTGADCSSAVPDNYQCAENYGRLDCSSGEQCTRDCSPIATGFTCDIAFAEALCVPDNFSCTTIVDIPGICPSGRRCGQGCTRDNNSLPSPLEQQCTVDFIIALPTITKTPKADEIWARLVAGTSSVFKRIFPKIGPDAPIASILDIPAATKVSYSGNVTVLAGKPGNQRPGVGAELYFPHIGGVQEYFLQCIQTALRPRGFGETCESGALTGLPPPTDACPVVPDSAIPGKWLGGFKQNFVSLANRWTASCPGPENNFADECYNYVVSESLSAGVNPAFALTIWVNETGASNYCHGGPTAQDFGINISSLYQNLQGQLERFLSLPRSGGYLSCRSQPGWIEDMHAFLNRFQAGGCNPGNSLGNTYYNHIRTFTWPLVSGGCVSGNRFSISWPTDNSCP